jgi:hypothetical protein
MKILITLLACFSLSVVFAQQDSVILTSPTVTTPAKKFDISNRPGDHLMIQVSSDHWTGMPDSIASHQDGFSRGLNMYIMTNKPFKGDPRFSVGIGIGVGSSNIFFKKYNVDIKSSTSNLPFVALDSTDHFKKYKVSTSYLEVPIELRFTLKPETPAKSLKLAVGAKVGTLINAHTKGKTLQNKNNQTVNSYLEKENSKKFFNSTRLMGTARLGYGVFSLFGSYQLNNVLKDGTGPAMKSYQIGITISGL